MDDQPKPPVNHQDPWIRLRLEYVALRESRGHQVRMAAITCRMEALNAPRRINGVLS